MKMCPWSVQRIHHPVRVQQGCRMNHTCGILYIHMLPALQLRPTSVCHDNDDKTGWQAILENAVTVVALGLPCR